jgi:NADPH-dependent 2,4-dienoyl-CoA reductase/sulfur reductase-like enzyme
VCGTEYPLEKVLGKEIGKLMLEEHKSNGVKVHQNAKVVSVQTCAEGNVRSVTLSDGSVIECQLVVMGTGVKPATEFLKDSGIELSSEGGVVCDPFLQTNVKNVYAAGDIASYPYWPTGSRIRTEHWVTSLDQGTYAAFNMLGKFVPYGQIPFFWTRHYNKSIHFVGSGAYSEVYI